MNPVTLRRIAIISAVLTVLVAIDGIYMLAARYNGNETQNFHLPDGATVLIAAVLLLIITIIAFVLSNRPAVVETTVPATGVASSEDAVVATPAEAAPVSESVETVQPEVQG